MKGGMPGKHGFQVVEERQIDELDTCARLYVHVRTGARLFSLENQDENKVFGITFRTPPEDSTGIAHIMEHSVLCGSEKYPLKKPFVELMKGSLKTFLNALTYPDKTCYPVASQNLKDFYNLIDVYLDAVFHPLIPPTTLQQEGWHYELDSVDRSISLKGVVYNEMKGAYSSPESLLAQRIQSTLFPDNPYGYDSGGDPESIPELSYEQFRAFHRRFYHPSNAYLFFYGDDPPEERLRIVDLALQPFDRREVQSSIALQLAHSSPKHVTLPYSAGSAEPNDERSYVTVSWLLPEFEDPQHALALSILHNILIGSPAAPLRKALLDSGLGTDLAGGGLHTELRQMYFSTGLKGVSDGDEGHVESLIDAVLRDLVLEGIEPLTVEAALNTVEFRLRENNSGSFPRGLSLMIRALRTWLYDGDPFAPLAFESPLNAIKTRFENGEQVFEPLIQEHLLENRHRVVLHMIPYPELESRREASERVRLEQVRAGMSPDEIRLLVDDTRRLKSLQEEQDPPDALAKIPTLRRGDLDRENKLIPTEVVPFKGSQVLFHDLFTNGIAYLDLGFDLTGLGQDLLPFVPLFGRSLLEMGTVDQDYVQLSQRISSRTGGIHPVLFTSAGRNSPRDAVWLFLRGKATAERFPDLLDILRDVLLAVRLDHRDRFRQILLEEKARQEADLVPLGHRLVNKRLRSSYNQASWADEQMSGTSYLLALREMESRIETDWPFILDKLEAVRAGLVNRQVLLANTTLDGESWSRSLPHLETTLESLPVNRFLPAEWEIAPDGSAEGLAIPARVNYVGKGASLYQQGYSLDGSVLAITKYLGTTWLWDRVRVQGGAYGGFCLFDRHSGVLTYLSYRDPNLLSTLGVFDGSGQFLRQGILNDDELRKSVIGAVGELDRYQLPDAKGFTAMARHLINESDADRQRLRDQLLGASLDDFHAFADVLDSVAAAGRVAVLGSQAALEAANAERPGFLKLQSVM